MSSEPDKTQVLVDEDGNAIVFKPTTAEITERSDIDHHQNIKADELGEDWGDGFFVSPEPDADSEGLTALRAAIAQLSPERYEVVSLKLYQELTFAEIGEVLGVSPNTAASRYRYALADLRKMLEATDERRSA